MGADTKGVDLNGDGVVNVFDLLQVAEAIRDAGAAPSAHLLTLEQLGTTDVAGWLTQAQGLGVGDANFQRGIRFLEQLLAALTPKETVLLPNYPNPFNPETWIPYLLAKPADVTLTIYAMNGQVVRQLSLGHQLPGSYESKSRAAYWDGRNEFGERVATGIYFYQLRADEISFLRKMVILK